MQTQIMIYRNRAELPDHFYYQAQAFSRIVWYDSETYDIDLDEPMTHIVLAKDRSLISYAEVLSKQIELNGISYRCAGLSAMMTFPFFRRRGFGGQVVEAAIAVMRDEVDADVALLWTDPENEAFYARYGWQGLPDMTTLIGDRDQPEIYDEELPMMLFFTEKAKQNRSQFGKGQVYVGEEQW